MENTINYRGIDIQIKQDNDIESPREWCNLGIMACFHGRYNLGDKVDMSLSDAKRIEKSDNYIVLPLYLYDHSGITMRTEPFSCPWDSGQVGIIYVSKTKVRDEYGVKRISPKLRNKVIELLKSEVNTYDQFITGQCYWYNIGETGGSCGGFFGDDHEKSGLLENAKSEIDYFLNVKEENKQPF